MISLARKSLGGYVRQWQEFLASKGYSLGSPDGVFGPRTDNAVRAFQHECGLIPDGVVGTGTFKAAVKRGWPAPDGYPLIQSTNYTAANRTVGDVDWVVMHTMEVPEASNIAEEISSRFAAADAKRASVHFCCDNGIVIQNVLLKDVAWGAEGGNRRGIQIELAGFSGQGSGGWADAFSTEMLQRAAGLVADLCKRFGVPTRWVAGEAIKRGDRGITGHAQINDAFKGQGQGHRDPGGDFPVDRFVALVRSAAGA